MAAAAGKRGPKPIDYFRDEYATLGSNSTPFYADDQFEDAIYPKRRKDNCLINSLILPIDEEGCGRAIANSVHSKLLFGEFIEDQECALRTYRELFYKEFIEHPYIGDRRNVRDISADARQVLAYYAPYLTLIDKFSSKRMPEGISKYLLEMVGFYDPKNRYALVERTVADYEKLASGEEYEHMSIHQRRMMEEIERLTMMVLRRCDPYNIDTVILKSIVYLPLEFRTIIKEFSRTEMEEFLIPAIAKRAEILHYAWSLNE